MALKLNSSSGSVTLTPEDGTGNVDVTLPRAGFGSPASIAVTVSGGNFLLDGAANQIAKLTPSVTYRFDQSDSSNASHPLKLSTTSDGTHGGGSAFTTGVTTVGTAGSSGAYVEVTLEQDAPYDLHYYCANHSGMGAAIEVASRNDISDFGVTATSTELNVLDGIPATLTATEIGYVDGVTSAIQTQIDTKGTVSTLSDLSITATSTELNVLDGIPASLSATEIGYVDGVTSAIQTQLNTKAPLASPALTGTPTAPTASAATNTTQVATTAFVVGEVSNLVDSAPSTLNTLNELAAALGDDASFSTTVTNSIATKLPLAGGTMTGNISHASDFTLDVGGNIIFDADGGFFQFKDGGTEIVRIFTDNSGDVNFNSMVQDKDIHFHGNDGGADILALVLDMSEAGAATFNSTVTATGVDVNGPLNTQDIRETVFTTTSTGGYLEHYISQRSIIYHTADMASNATVNITGNSGSVTANSLMAVGESVTIANIRTQGSTAYYINSVQVDGSTVTPKWIGGAPSAGNASGIDVYSFTVIKTANATFTVLASLTQYA